MKRALSLLRRMPPVNLCLTRLVAGSCLMYLANFSIVLNAQAMSPIIPSGLNTQVSTPLPAAGSKTQFDITGGTRAGTNLFHSFEQFDVPTNNIANFLNDSGLATSHILGRVTNGNPSSIFGTIQTTGFDNANLFLMNPSGIIFGPTASLNVGGSVTFSTADYFRLSDGVRFNAVPNAAADALLSTAPVSAYGFLDSSSGTIALHGTQFKRSDGSGISLVGGNITVQSGTLNDGTIRSAHLYEPGGQINLASVDSRGEITAANFMATPDITLGDITLSQNTFLDVSANRAGTVRIRGGQLTIDGATVSADTINANGSSIAIDIHVIGTMALANELSPTLTARTTGTGTAGAINITSGNLEATTSPLPHSLVALVDTQTSGTGTAGNVSITTGNLHATNEAFFIDTGTTGTGHGGDISIQGTNVKIEGPNVATGNFRFGQLLEQDVRGSAGNLTIKAADGLQIGPAATISTEAWFAQGGNITLEGRDVSIIGNSFVSVDGDFGGATLTVNANKLRLDFASVLNSNTVVDPGGEITINAKAVELTEGSQIRTSTLGNGTAGDIKITASEHLTLDGRNADEPEFPSAIVSNFYGDPEFSPNGIGDSGSITIASPHLQILGGALINTSTNTTGNAGNITIYSNSLKISGQSPFEVSNASIGIGSTRGSGIYTRTIGSDLCVGACGQAGNITILTDSLNVDNGGTVNSGTTNDGFGGNIAITAKQSVIIQDSSTISANSTGSGDAGSIFINAGQQLEVLDGSSITTQAAKASGGNIDIRAIDRIRFVNSTVSTSVLAEDGKGGNIFIDPNIVILEGSEVAAKAVGGAGGNITFVTPLFLADSASLSRLSAKSESGLNGTVTIQSPTSNLSGTVGQLASKTNPPQVLLQNRCVALAGGEQSTFILAGRDALPSEPGGWLSSPVAMEHWTGEETEEQVSGVMVRSRGWNTQPVLVMSKDETTVLSLQRLTPPGFLVRSFAVSAATGCSS